MLLKTEATIQAQGYSLLTTSRTIADLCALQVIRIKSMRKRIRVWTMEELKLAYIPVPKAASSSIRTLFMQVETGADLISDNSVAYARTRKKLKRSIRQSRHPDNFSDLKKNYYLFSFVRNPLTRLFSCYQDKVVDAEKIDKKCAYQPYGIRFGMSFNDFVQVVSEIPDNIAEQHFRSSSTFLTKDEKLLVDYVGKLEQFTDHWQVLSRKFNLPLPPRTHRTSSNQVLIQDIPISPSGIELVLCRYRRDIDLFGYREILEQLLTRKSSSL